MFFERKNIFSNRLFLELEKARKGSQRISNQNDFLLFSFFVEIPEKEKSKKPKSINLLRDFYFENFLLFNHTRWFSKENSKKDNS
jgi:hypothetical protein